MSSPNAWQRYVIGRAVLEDPTALRRLAAQHELDIRQEETHWLRAAAARGKRLREARAAATRASAMPDPAGLLHPNEVIILQLYQLLEDSERRWRARGEGGDDDR